MRINALPISYFAHKNDACYSISALPIRWILWKSGTCAYISFIAPRVSYLVAQVREGLNVYPNGREPSAIHNNLLG